MKARAGRVEPEAGAALGWQASIETELGEVEECLMSCITSDVQTVFELSRHIVTAGGKRLRPGLVILSARAMEDGSTPASLVPISATVELIHMASLIHDDVIDNSESRRGRTTANAFWGNKISVLSGDCMLARAFSLLAQHGDHRVMQVLADMTNKMSESEVLQALCEGDIEMWRKHYWQIIRHKTAGFLSACCRCGAILADASEDEEEALADYGMELGMAFQLTDDLLDIIGDPVVTGKPVGNDVRDGKITLPVLLALDAIPEPDQVRLRAALSRKDSLSPAEIERICGEIRASGAIEMAREQAASCAERAISKLDIVSDSEAKSSLITIATQIINRVS